MKNNDFKFKQKFMGLCAIMSGKKMVIVKNVRDHCISTGGF